MKDYILKYLDKGGNELQTKSIHAFNIKEARQRSKDEFACCKLNDCVKVKAVTRKSYDA